MSSVKTHKKKVMLKKLPATDKCCVKKIRFIIEDYNIIYYYFIFSEVKFSLY